MNKKEYSKLLQSSKWKSKRKIILKRDANTCQICLVSKDIMHVHHKYYVVGKNPWEYPNSALVTLCEECHSELHNTTKIPIHDKELNKTTYKPAKKKVKSLGNKRIKSEFWRKEVKLKNNEKRKERFNSAFPQKEHTIGRIPARLKNPSLLEGKF